MAKRKKEELLLPAKSDNILLESRVDVEELKDDLKSYINEKINEVVINELDKSTRKQLREKNRRIFIKNIVILLLLVIIGFLLYLLYDNNYFDRFFNKGNLEPTNEIVDNNSKDDEKKNENKDDKKEETKEELPPKKPTLEELKREYGSLIDNYYVLDISSYIVDFYDGKLTDNIKKYMTLNSFDFTTIKAEEDYNIINEETFKIIYNKLFNNGYTSGSFEYNDNKIRYVSLIDSYMTTSLLKKEKNNITREIINIEVNDDMISIETVEGIIKNNKLYNIIYNSEVENYQGDSLVNYKDSLNKITYNFKNNKLISLSK